MNKYKPLILVGLVLTGFILFASAYIVDETEQVVITQFGKAVGEPVKTPGLKFKVPFIQKANYFPKNLQEWDGDPGQVPTKDKTFIWVDTFARWKIVDPVKYFQTVNNMVSALGRLDDIIDPAMRNFLTSFRLVESVRNSDRPMDTFEGIGDSDKAEGTIYSQYRIKVGRSEITKRIMAQAQPKLKPFGIELVDVKIKRINYVEKVRDAVYGRMIAERSQIAEKFRAEGKGEASNIRGDKEKDLQRIKSEAYKAAEEIKGKADAEATAIYAASYGADPEFYSFLKTLEVYKSTLDKSSSLVLSTDSDFMKYFKGIKQK
ncbi:HflC [Desulfamplus magnetovallimortis]|uniref:Protein HflC n=1 Tax=Desulfamplus magnetovallimortis TaxID=1246637 RepID=A0A1W1HKF0_9BACT|nr:protease modulator HflC [Desulfamplus magnetovallimortis]SLM32933.1 HflC [Desulfamplus magnetovallimortis]